jgi:cathepsin A (carboxypeptidase C)
MHLLTSLAVVQLFWTVSVAAPEKEAVSHLPGWGVPPAPQWSGFLNASAVEPGTMLHYWFAQAEGSDLESMPVVLWLNGGPGSSSILGMLQEQGPLLINATGGLMRNPYAWTKQANLLILESPAGVGYSYCEAMLKGGNCHNTDITTARAARAALQDFFKTKFPELRHNRFFITGESYAGVYIPTLTKEILDHAPEINIKGIAVGDPCTDTASQAESMDMLWYAHKHGLVPDADFDFLWNNCSHRQPSFLARGHWRREAGRWADTRPSQVTVQEPALQQSCKIAHRRFLATTSRGLSQSWPGSYINELDLFADAAALDWSLPGTLNYYNAKWMNSPDVRKALHVEDAPSKAWPGPPEGWQYTSSYSACNSAPEGTPSMINFYRDIAPRLTTTIVFNGDVDPCVSYEGTRTAIEKVGFPILPGGHYRPWFYDKKAADLKTLKEKPNLFGPSLELRDAGAQFGGQVVNYEHNLSFATVHGSGHMVPQFQPQAAERLLDRLLSGGLFAPPLPSDEDLGSMSDADFDASVDKWTKVAEKSALKSSAATIVV